MAKNQTKNKNLTLITTPERADIPLSDVFKKNIVLKVIAALLFAAACFYDSRLIFDDDIFATPDKVFFLPVTGRVFVLAFGAFLLAFAVLSLLSHLKSMIEIDYEPVANKPGRKDYLIWLAVFGLLILAWLPYILSYFPGGVYPDTATCIGQARSGDYNNQQPLLYTFIFKACIALAGDLSAVTLFSILQAVFMAGCFSYIIFRLYLHKVNKLMLAIIFAYFALFNLVPLYVISLWKDTLYSAAILMYIFLLAERIILPNVLSDRTAAANDYAKSANPTSLSTVTKQKWVDSQNKTKSAQIESAPTIKDIITILFWMVLTIFLRNNGIYVMFLTFGVLVISFGPEFISYVRTQKTPRPNTPDTNTNAKTSNTKPQTQKSADTAGSHNNINIFFIATLAVLVICFLIQGPLFSRLKLNGPFVENLGVMQQQVAYVQVIGGEMSPEEAEFLNRVCPLETMKAYYRPFDVDVIKWCAEYDNEFLEANKVEFLKVWFGMLLKNPKLYLDSYLYITLGYWDPYKQIDISYVNPEMWPDLRDIDRYHQSDIIADLGLNSIRDSLMPKPERLYSSAAFLFITISLLVISVSKKNKFLAVFTPALGTYLTVFIATPLAFALRYVYIVVLTVPIYLFISFIKADN